MSKDEDEIRNLVAAWMAATKAGDAETILALMAEDVVFLVPGQPVMHKLEFAAVAKSMSGLNAPQIDSKSVIQEIQICGDWAFMRTNLTVIVTPPGATRTITRAGNTLSIFQKHGGRWLLARDANLLTTVSLS
jgi:uncharacterized protein (TIGR02246 family)